jgi:hypothetical protein
MVGRLLKCYYSGWLVSEVLVLWYCRLVLRVLVVWSVGPQKFLFSGWFFLKMFVSCWLFPELLFSGS